MSQPANSEEHQYKGQQSPLASQRAKQQRKEEGDEAPPKKTWFPLGAKEGFSQWWANISPAAAEHKVLSFVPYLQQPPTQMQTGNDPNPNGSESPSEAPSQDDLSKSVSQTTESSKLDDPYGPRRWHSSLVKLAGKNRAINEFSIERVGEEVTQNLVMLHGYGAGLGFFYKNFEPLSRLTGWRLYALDLLGMGRSSRPPFRIHAKDREDKITEAEQWFVESLEEWRKERNIDRLTLLGHSLGGYMAVAYALKYPGHINKLILASPVGIPEDPYAVSSDLPEPDDPAVTEEINQDQSESTSRTSANKPPSDTEPKRRTLPKWLTVLWDANFSPFAIVRWAGPLGPRLVSGWTSRRFSQLPPEEAQALHDYAYSLFRQRGSGEYALGYILAPGAFARSPLIRRIGHVGRGLIPTSTPAASSTSSAAASTNGEVDAESVKMVRERGVPVTLIYGENDWMDVAGGFDAAERIKEAKRKALEGASAEDRRRDEGGAEVFIVRKAGHHVYLDGWEEFNELMEREMKDVEVRERSRARWLRHGP